MDEDDKNRGFTNREALFYHSTLRPGKIEIVPSKPVATQRDLSLAYSPGEAAPELLEKPISGMPADFATAPAAVTWSACGEDVILRTNPSVRVQTTQNKPAVATLDSEDINASIVYQLQWKSC